VNFISILRCHLVDSTSSRIRYTQRVYLAHTFTNIEQSGSLLNLHFQQSDLTYDWMLAYLVTKLFLSQEQVDCTALQRSEDALKGSREFSATTKQSDLRWGTGPNDAVRYVPAQDAKLMFRFESAKSGKKTWIQVIVRHGLPDYRGRVSIFFCHVAQLSKIS
jgi:hypothetical protein